MYHINCITSIDLGSQQDDEKTIEIDFTEWFQTYGYLELHLWHERANGVIYEASVSQNNNILSWIIGSTDRAVVGEGRYQIIGIANDLRVKSKIYPTYVRR